MADETMTLLPCPFCGETGVSVHEGSTFRWMQAECDHCGASVGEVRVQTLGDGTTKEWLEQGRRDAIDEWNRRDPTIAESKVPDGVALIATERSRQLTQEGWTIEHDDEHAGGELALAAASYASGEKLPSWPWGDNWWKPSRANRIRELQKAGALIAAEIDRLLRKKDVGHER